MKERRNRGTEEKKEAIEGRTGVGIKRDRKEVRESQRRGEVGREQCKSIFCASEEY